MAAKEWEKERNSCQKLNCCVIVLSLFLKASVVALICIYDRLKTSHFLLLLLRQLPPEQENKE